VARHLVERLDDVASHSGRVVPVCTPGEPSTTLAGLLEQSRRHASALSQLGVRDRDTVAFLVEPSVSTLAAIVGCGRLGASVVVLPKMARAGAAAGLQRRFGIVRETLRPSLLVHDGLEPDALARAAVHVDALAGAAAHSDPEVAIAERDPEHVAVVQLTSGTTGEPRCLALTHGQISGHVDAIAEAAAFRTGRECFVSWLPLYHDMGLIGTTILPLVLGMDLILGSPVQFLLDPPSWMGWIDRYHGTVTVAPDSGYAVAARVLASCDTLDLSSLRLAFNGSEPIAVDAFAGFFTNGARHGLHPSAAFCVYGMAEATLAVTFPRAGGGMQVDAFDRPTMERSGYAKPAEAGVPTSVTAAPCRRPRDATPHRHRRVSRRVVARSTASSRARRAWPHPMPRRSAPRAARARSRARARPSARRRAYRAPSWRSAARRPLPRVPRAPRPRPTPAAANNP
jgi:fatty-acyl-CoA synthase